MSVCEHIVKLQVVPVIAVGSPDVSLPLVDTLIEGALPIAGITFRTEAAMAVIRKMSQKRPTLL